MSVCLSLEEPLRVSYLGPKGTYTQLATQNHFGKSVLSMPEASVEEVFASVEKEILTTGSFLLKIHLRELFPQHLICS